MYSYGSSNPSHTRFWLLATGYSRKTLSTSQIFFALEKFDPQEPNQHAHVKSHYAHDCHCDYIV